MNSQKRTERTKRILQHQFKSSINADHPNLIPLMDENDMFQWYFLVVGMPHPYIGGEYIFKLTAPEKYPQMPPKFEFLTKNGVFGIGGRICISIGEFHALDAAGKTGSYGWRPSLGMIGFAREVVNGMLVPDNLGGGIRVLGDPTIAKIVMAKNSVSNNRKKHAKLVAAFRGVETKYPKLKAVKTRQRWAAVKAVRALDVRDVGVARMAKALKPSLDSDWHYIASYFKPENATRLRVLWPRLYEAAAEHEAIVRQILVLAIRVHLCNESDMSPIWAEFMELLPIVCGGACRELVPNALKFVTPSSEFASLHVELAQFIREQDIDKKSQMGHALAKSITTVQ